MSLKCQLLDAFMIPIRLLNVLVRADEDELLQAGREDSCGVFVKTNDRPGGPQK